MKKIKKDFFEISDGNLKVLETIPKLMKSEIYRRRLRGLVLDFLYESYGAKNDEH